MTTPHVLIIGAGLAGPALALALARHSIRSTIFERRPSIQDIGGVISLAPNAMRVLDKIVGIEPDIRRLGQTFSGFEMQACSMSGVMEALGAFGFDDSLGVKGVSLKRPLFHAKLLELCEEKSDLIQIKWDKNLRRIEEKFNGVTAFFEDDSQAEGGSSSGVRLMIGDIVLGTDGIHSKVRQHVLGGLTQAQPFSAKYTGHVVLGSQVPRSQVDFDPTFNPPAFILTQAGSILVFPIDETGETIQWAAFLEAPERDKKAWAEYKFSGEAIKDFHEQWKGMTAGPIRTLLDSLTPENLLLWAPYATPDLPTWHTDRVCLLGDAAHAISPSAGQGTAQALEDVGLLVRLLTSQAAMSKGYPALFAHYEKVRRKRIEVIRRMTDRTLADRAPVPSYTKFWLKKQAYKVILGAVDHVRGFLPANPTMYDVTKESIEV